MTAIIERKRVCLHTQKARTIAKHFIYKKPDNFQKTRQFPFMFCIQKAIHLTLRVFCETSEVGIYMQKL